MLKAIKEFFDASPPYLLSIAASICLVLAVCLSLQENLKGAVLLSSLFFLCVMLAYFPQLERVKAFTVDVKLRKSIDHAEEVLEHLKKLSVVSAKVSYMILAWQNRWGGASVKDKQAMLDDINHLLSELNISSSEKDEITRPYVHLIGFDLYHIFNGIIEKYALWKKNNLKLPDKMQSFSNEIDKWRKDCQITSSSTFDPYSALRREIPTTLLDNHEQDLANRFRQYVIVMYDDCKKKGGLTDKAIELIDNCNDAENSDRKMREIFNTTLQ